METTELHHACECIMQFEYNGITIKSAQVFFFFITGLQKKDWYSSGKQTHSIVVPFVLSVLQNVTTVNAV